MLLGGVEYQQVAQQVLIAAVLVAHAALEVHAEVAEELFVLGPVVAHELFKLTLDALFKVLADNAQLPVMLQELTGNVQREIGGVDNALDELKVIMDELVALLHYHDAVGV